jgi:hypothetical protein
VPDMPDRCWHVPWAGWSVLMIGPLNRQPCWALPKSSKAPLYHVSTILCAASWQWIACRLRGCCCLVLDPQGVLLCYPRLVTPCPVSSTLLWQSCRRAGEAATTESHSGQGCQQQPLPGTANSCATPVLGVGTVLVDGCTHQCNSVKSGSLCILGIKHSNRFHKTPIALV